MRGIACIVCTLACALGLTLGLVSCAQAPLAVEKQEANLGFLETTEGELMLPLNTEVMLTTVQDSVRDAMKAEAEEQVFALHKLIDAHHAYTASNGDPVTNVFYLNQHFGEGPIEIDPALFACLEEALTMAELTEGFFNPTIGAVSDVYEGRFEQTGEVQEGPSADQLESALASVVPVEELREYIVLDEAAGTVELLPYKGQQFRLTLSAIGKGFALDQLAFSQDSSFLISAGSSSIRAHIGSMEERAAEPVSWNVATYVPDATDILLAFRMDEGSVSVSGDDENYYLLEDGTRVHHILNPFTGKSENFWRNVVLVGDKAGVLDALSTALFNVEDEQRISEIVHNVEEHYGISIDFCFVQKEEPGMFQLRGNQGFFDRLIPEYVSDVVDQRMYIFE